MFSWYAAVIHLEDVLAALLYFLIYPRRTAFPLRLTAGGIGTTLVVGVLSTVQPQGFFPRILQFSAFFVLILVFMMLCFKTTPAQALFSAISGRATQHFVNNLLWLLDTWMPDKVAYGTTAAGELGNLFLFYLPTYAVFYWTLARRIDAEEFNKEYNNRIKILSVAVLMITFGISRFARDYGAQGRYAVTAQALYAMTCCVFALVIQLDLGRRNHQANEMAVIRQIWQEDKRRMAQSKTIAEMINIRCHDIRHKLAHYNTGMTDREKEELAELVNLYDMNWHTGNPTLDILLAEKGTLCKKNGIQLTCMGDASALHFLSEMEVYSLFGNALDNAIHAVQALPPEQRQISIVLKCRGGMVSVSVDNYYSGTLTFQDGLPQTTAPNSQGDHGYGMKSMRMLARKYGGDLSARAENGTFSLRFWLMSPTQS